MKNKIFRSKRSIYGSLGRGEKLSHNLKYLSLILITTFFTIASTATLHLQEITDATSGSSDGSFLSSDNMFEVKFPNTTPSGTDYRSNETIILKTFDDKYVLIDTASKNSEFLDAIYNNLYDYQQKEKVTIDYFIISHFHSDHVGNARSLLEDTSRFEVKNVIVKYEKTNEENNLNSYKFETIINAAKAASANIYTTDNVGTSVYQDDDFSYLTEGQKFPIGDYLNLYIYNTSDVFENQTCQKGYMVRFAAYSSQEQIDSSASITKFNGQYIYFDGSTYPNIELKTTPEFIRKNDNARGLDRYFYAYVSSNVSNCNSNGNSLAVFAEVTDNTNTKKYAYFPSDLENIGYRLTPEDGIYANGYTVLYENPEDFYNSETGEINPSNINPTIKVPSETNIAKRIKTDFGEAAVNNITIYQAAHHHLNNAPDAINEVNLNKPSTYSIATYRDNLGGYRITFDATRYQYYALDKAVKLYTGHSADGISCIINAAGTTYCGYEAMSDIQTHILTLNQNYDESTTLEQNCIAAVAAGTTTASCSINISSTTPTRAGYTFLGWANDASATTATYQPGAEITLTADKTIYAVWEENTSTFTLSYDANDTDDASNIPDDQTCTISGTETSCSINISDTTPARTGYTFLGWANDASATTATYQPGAEITLTADKTIYAVWEENSTPAPDEDDDEDEDDEFIVVPNTGSSTDTNNSPTHSIINISTITIITASIVIFNIHKRIRNKKNALKF